jgi:hypothetical protein
MAPEVMDPQVLVGGNLHTGLRGKAQQRQPGGIWGHAAVRHSDTVLKKLGKELVTAKVGGGQAGLAECCCCCCCCCAGWAGAATYLPACSAPGALPLASRAPAASRRVRLHRALADQAAPQPQLEQSTSSPRPRLAAGGRLERGRLWDDGAVV